MTPPPAWLDDEADVWEHLVCDEGDEVTLTAAGGSDGHAVYAILAPWAELIDERGETVIRRRRVQRCQATLHLAAVRAALDEQLGEERDLRPGDTLQPVDAAHGHYYAGVPWRVGMVHHDGDGVTVADLERAIPYDAAGEGAR